MDHQKIREKIHAYYDLELCEEERREVGRHLEVCSDCRGRYEDWAKVASIFFKSPAVQAPEFFTEKVMARLREEGRESEEALGFRDIFRWLVPAMGFLLGSLIFLTVLISREQTPFSPSDLLAVNMEDQYSMEALF